MMRALFIIWALSGSVYAQNSSQPQFIRNKSGVIIASVENNYGRLVLKDGRSGRTLGWYVTAENKTYSANGLYYGQGNRLGELLGATKDNK